MNRQPGEHQEIPMNIRTIRRFLTATLSVAALVSPAAAHDPMWHSQETEEGLQPASFELPLAGIALWRPGSGVAIKPQLGVKAENYDDGLSLAALVGQPGDDRSIADFERYQVGDETYFALVYSTVERAEKLIPDAAQVAASLTDLGGSWHLADFETFTSGGQRRWSALYRAGARNLTFSPLLTGTDLVKRVEAPHEADLQHHLADFEVLIGTGGVRFAALFDDEPGEQKFFPALSAEDFHTRTHDLHEAGYRLADVEGWQTAEGLPRIAALFTKATRPDHLWAFACIENCANKANLKHVAEELEAQVLKLGDGTLRLVDLELPLGQLVELLKGSKSAPAPKARHGRKRPRAGGPGEITSPPIPPTGNHAGLLHDAGTNGPP